MGNDMSRRKPSSGSDEDASSSSSSRRSSHFRDRFKFRRRHANNSSSSDSKLGTARMLSADNFSGIVRIELVQAEMQFKDKWFACISLGEQTFKTVTSSKLSVV